jgi:hypothetical protein
VESCGLPDRINKLFGTKIMAFVQQEKKPFQFFPTVFGQI